MEFISTKGYAQFEEFAKACSTYRYIGVFHGRPGVGKTRSATEFARWSTMKGYETDTSLTPDVRKSLESCEAMFYTAPVANTPKTLQMGLRRNLFRLGHAKLRLEGETDKLILFEQADYACPMVIVDEADRLSLKSLEQLRDFYDQYGFALILLGMPGLEKRLARYPQFYSRIGFVHEFKPLGDDEMRFIFEKSWSSFGLKFDPECFSDVEAMTAAIRITRGNFRLIERLFAQVSRIMRINNMDAPTVDAINAARDCLVIGVQD